MLRQKTPTRELQDLDHLIASVYSELAGYEATEEGFDKATDQLKKLLELRAKIAPQTRVSPDVLATVGANLLGILAILSYEHAHVITSKALQFVIKLR